MRRTTIVFAGSVLVFALSLPGGFAQQRPQYQEGQGVEARERFEGRVGLSGPRTDAAPRPLQVSLRNWAVRGGQRVERLPEDGFQVVHLLAGEVTTIIGGQRAERREGEFWTVPAGTAMGVETEDDTALLQVFTVEPAGGSNP